MVPMTRVGRFRPPRRDPSGRGRCRAAGPSARAGPTVGRRRRSGNSRCRYRRPPGSRARLQPSPKWQHPWMRPDSRQATVWYGQACRFQRFLIVGGVRTATSADQSEGSALCATRVDLHNGPTGPSGAPPRDAESKGYDDFHAQVAQRGVFRAGEAAAAGRGCHQRPGPQRRHPDQRRPGRPESRALAAVYLLECDDLDHGARAGGQDPGASSGRSRSAPSWTSPPRKPSLGRPRPYRTAGDC